MRFSQRLFIQPEDQTAFIEALIASEAADAAILWTHPRPNALPFRVQPPLEWQPAWIDRLEPQEKPGQHPLHTQGYYYCLDFSSVFAASVLSAIPGPVPLALDLCSAPGGKSLFAWRMLSPNRLWCNEVVRKRGKALISNLKRCGVYSAKVFNLNPEVFAEVVPQAISLMIVDAPCSGQSLLAKGGKAEGCFHRVTIHKNASRQKHILAKAAATVAAGGYLAYMTCTFSPEENEKVCQWFVKKFPQFEPVRAPHLSQFQSHLSDHPCYRLWPQSGLGAGAFTALFRNIHKEFSPNPDPLDAFEQSYGWVLHPSEDGA